MNEGQRMIEEARRQHEENAKVNPYSFTYSRNFNKVIGTEEELRAKYAKKDEENRVEIYNKLGPKEYIRYTYASICYKHYITLVLESICQLLIASNIKDTKKIVKEFRDIAKVFNGGAHTQHEKDIQEMIVFITDEWMPTLKSISNAQHYAYSNALIKKHQLTGNTADLAAWFFTLRDMCLASKDHDENYYVKMNEIVAKIGGHVQKNELNPCFTLEVVLNKFIVNMFGKDVNISSKDIELGRKTIKTQLEIFQPYDLVIEFLSKKVIENAKRRCPAERCKDCNIFPCNTYKDMVENLKEY